MNQRISTVKDKLRVLDAEISDIETTLKRLPNGTASVYYCDGRRRISGRLNGKNHYYTKAELPLAKKLMLKQYLNIRLEELAHLKALLTAQLEYEQKWMGLSERYFAEHPEHMDLLAEFFTRKSEPLTVWMNAPDTAAAPFQEERVIQVNSRLYVRSKSEALIASVLYEHSIPFRYEEPLVLGNRIYYPDFTIRDPKTGEVFIYEHFGMMDDEDYVQRAIDKLADYVKYGLIPAINLIMTFETKSDPLDVIRIENALEIII